MASFDSASKRLVQKNPRDFVAFCFKLRNMTGEKFTDVELITPEQPTVEMHQTDVLIKVKFRGKFVLVHFEIQIPIVLNHRWHTGWRVISSG